MRNLFLLTFLALTCHFASAQQRTISGVVLDDGKQPLAGVAVVVKGTSVGVSTNGSGQYRITTDAPNPVLVFSLVGHASQEIAVQGKTLINVTMDESATALDEVEVAVGYGTVRRADLTGSVASVDMEDMSKVQATSFDSAMAGLVAGVNVTAQDGQPGSPSTITIRGGNSITQSNAPLYVIDGFPLENPDNNMINPADIASIDILKDASATAIYGARGANGVVMITTKTGVKGKPSVNVRASLGLQNNIKKMDMMGAYEFVKYQLDLNEINATKLYLGGGKTLDDYRNARDIDWQDQLFQTAKVQNYGVQVSGGTDNTKYLVSGSILNQDGVIIKGGFKRYQGRMLLDQKLGRDLRFYVTANYTATETYGIVAKDYENSTPTESLMYSVMGFRPTSGNLDPDFNYADEFIDDLGNSNDIRINPIYSAKNEHSPVYNNVILANSYLEYQRLKKITFKVAGNITNGFRRSESFRNTKTRAGSPQTPTGRENGVNGWIRNENLVNWSNENTVSYKDVFGQHSLNAVAGFSAQKQTDKGYYFKATHIPNESLGISGLGEGTPVEIKTSNTVSTMESFFGRVNYDYKKKYYLTATFRADGSSRFPTGNKWGYFPSGSLAWYFAREGFVKKLGFISGGKVRVSYGVTGNNRVGNFAYMSTLIQSGVSGSSNSTIGYPFNNAYQPGVYPSALGNGSLKWESTAQWDAGLDIAFLDNRISLVLDYYYKKTNDLLLRADIPSSTGYLTGTKNIGKVSNEGVEITLNTVNIRNRNFQWTTNFNISFNRNKILELNGDQPSLTTMLSWNGNYNNAHPYIALPGMPVASFYGYIFDGVYQYSDFIESGGNYVLRADVPNNGNAASTIKPGDIKYKDLNGDGVVNSYDQTVIGSPYPTHTGGFTNNFYYKNFDLNVLFTWSYGNQLLNGNRMIFMGGENRTNLNQLREMENRWSPDNLTSRIPRAGGAGPAVYSDRFIEDASFLRLRNVSLGYTFSKIGLVSALRLYVTGTNLFTWTKYSGPDPEVSVKSNPLTPGFDWSAYPKARTITFGLDITF